MRLRSVSGVLLVAVVLLFIVPSAVQYYTDWLWFEELGYREVFLRTLDAQSIVFTGTFLVALAFLYLNLQFARRRTMTRAQIVLGTGADGRPFAIEGRRLAGLAAPFSMVVALIMGLVAASDWLEWLNFFHGAPFGDRDVLFHREIGFYVFRLPIFETIREEALLLTVLAVIGCGVYYVFSGSFVLESRPGVSSWPRIRLVPAARLHLSLLAALIFGLMAWGQWIEVASALLEPTTSSVTFGASYADVFARIPFLWITLVTLGIGAVLAIWHGFTRPAWPLPLAIAAYVAVSIVSVMYSGFVQRFVVTPNEQDKERPYIVNNIEATRRAYGLDKVEERELSGDAELTANDIIDNAGTIENVRLWDHQPLLQTFSQIQEIRTYYDFESVDNDRYTIDGKYRQVMLSARELNTDNMPNRSWINERLVFTHGYGITLGPVNQVTTEGLPVLFIRDLPPVSTVDLRLDQPSIYYGELSNSYVLVKTRQPEFDYPKGDDNETTFYGGTGGVPVGLFWRRLLFAIRFGSTDILVTDQFTPESRIMFHRRIGERVRLLAPFLSFDSDPYPVVSGGRLFWIQDAYTTTDQYPYLDPVGAVRRHVAQLHSQLRQGRHRRVQRHGVLLHCRPGRPARRNHREDLPGHAAADRRHAGGFARARAVPAGHPADPSRDVHHVPHDQSRGLLQQGRPVAGAGARQRPERRRCSPYYTIMRLPGETKSEFIQMLPFTPRAKDNLSAWIAARSDGTNYGRLVVYQFPKQKIVYGPTADHGTDQSGPGHLAPRSHCGTSKDRKSCWGPCS